ncbi:hypothetical protein K2X85_00675 [bacterium]|nr:hypothetical protein [bacterium]
MICSRALLTSTLLALPMAWSWSAPVPITMTIDPTRSAVTANLLFRLGGLALPVTEVSPGSLTSPVVGTLSGFFDPVANTLGLTDPLRTVRLPDTKSYSPSISLGELSSLGGSFGVPGIINGILSFRRVSFSDFFLGGPTILLSDFDPENQSIGSGYFVPSSSGTLSTGIDAGVDYSVSGLISSSGTIPIQLSRTTEPQSAFVLRTGRNNFEVTLLNLDRNVSIGTFTVGGVPVEGTLRFSGQIVLTGTSVPEVNSTIMLGIGLLSILGIQLLRRRNTPYGV